MTLAEQQAAAERSALRDLVQQYGPGQPDPDCLRCDVAQVYRIMESKAHQRDAAAHLSLMRGLGVDPVAAVTALQEMRAEGEAALPPRACVYHLVPVQGQGQGAA